MKIADIDTHLPKDLNIVDKPRFLKEYPYEYVFVVHRNFLQDTEDALCKMLLSQILFLVSLKQEYDDNFDKRQTEVKLTFGWLVKPEFFNVEKKEISKIYARFILCETPK